MQPVKNVVQLRQLLAEKFPGVRMGTESPSETQVWTTGLSCLDNLLGGLPRGGMTELVCKKTGAGTALLMGAILQRASAANQLTVLIDAQDSFDPAPLGNDVLSRLLWVRCQTAEQALKAVDLLLRDRNLGLILLDLQLNPAAQLRKISSSVWYRLQRIIEHTSTVFLIVTPQPMVSNVQARVSLSEPFKLDALADEEEILLSQLRLELIHRRSSERENGQRVAEAG